MPNGERSGDYWRNRAAEIALQHGLDPAMFTRQMYFESGFNPDVMYGRRLSSAGAIGVAQFMPGTAQAYGVDPYDPESSLHGAALYLRDLYSQLGGQGGWRLAVTGYLYGGGGAQGLYERYGENWFQHLKPEEQDYVEYIMGKGQEHALTPVIARPRAPYPKREALPPGFEEIPEFYSGYKDLLLRALREEETRRQRVNQSGDALAANYASYVQAPYTTTDMEDYLKAKGHSKDDIDLILHSEAWYRSSGLTFEQFQSRKEGLPSYEQVRKEVQYAQRLSLSRENQPAISATEEFQRATTMRYLIQNLPYMMASGDISTLEDVEALLTSGIGEAANMTPAYQYTLTPEDRQFVSDLLQQLAPVVPYDPEATIDEVTLALTQRPRPEPRTLSSMTADQISRMFTGRMGPELPGGLEMDTVREMYREMDMTDPEYRQQVEDIRGFTQEQGTLWLDQMIAAETYKSGLRLPELPKLTTMQKVKMAFTQPGMAALELIESYRRNWAMPVAAGFTMAASSLAQRVGLPPIRGTVGLQEAFDKSQAEGYGYWNSLQRAFEEWDAPGGVKLLTEILGDPTTYVGLGLATKLTRAVPLVGPLVRSVEGGWIAAWDAPFAALRAGMRKIPMTASQFANKMGSDFYANLQRAYLNRFTKTSIANATEEEWGILVRESLDTFVNNPGQSTGALWDLGNSLTKARRFIEADEIGSWLKRLKVEGVELTPQRVHDVNYIYELLQDSSLRGFLKTREATPKILQILGVDDSAENLLKMAKVIDTRLSQDIDNILRSMKGNPNEALRRTSLMIRDIHLANTQSGVWSFAGKTGKAMALARIGDRVLGWRVLNLLDRAVVRPVANAYLIFGMYGPFNYLETLFRGLRGRAGWVGRRSRYAADIVQEDLAYLLIPNEFRTGVARMEMAITPTAGETILPQKLGFMPKDVKSWVQKTAAVVWDPFNPSGRWARAAHKGRGRYILNKYPTTLMEIAPNEMRFISESIPNFREAGLKSLTREEMEELQERVLLRAIQGPDAVRELKMTAEAMMARRYEADVTNIVYSHPELPEPIANTIIMKARRGELAGNVDRVMQEAADALKDYQAGTSLQRARAGLSKWAEDVLGTPITNEEELWRAMKLTTDMSQGIDDTIEEFRHIVTERGHELHAIPKDKFHRATHEELMAFFDEFEPSVGRAIAKLRAEIPKMAKAEDRPILESLLDTISNKERVLLETRIEERAIREGYIRKAPTRADVDWAASNAEVHEVWGRYRRLKHEFDLQFEAAAARIGKPFGSIKEVVGDLAPVDITRLFASTGDDVSRNLTSESMTLMPRDLFVGKVRIKAETLAAQAGRTADDLGYTEEAIARVYDQIVASLRMDPGAASAIQPFKEILEDVRQRLHYTTQTRALPEGEVQSLNRYLERVSGSLEDTPMYEAPQVMLGRGYRTGRMEPTPPGLMATEGEGLYVARDYELAEFFAAREGMEDLPINPVYFDPPHNPLKADELYILHESDELFEAIKATDSEWLKFNKKAIKNAGVTDANWGTKTESGELSTELTRLIREAGYDAVEVVQDEPFWVLLDENLWKDVKPPTATATSEWAATREKAMEKVRTQYSLDFTDYSDQNMFDAFMRRIYPFWTYESQRWPFLARAFIQTPGVAVSWGKYMDYSDTGYVHIPTTDFQLNPFRGTVFMGGMRRFVIRDYPEYYDEWPLFPEVNDYLSRAGFYPGIHVTLPLAAWGAASPAYGGPQWGELLPASIRTGLSALAGVNPTAASLYEKMLPDRFRSFQIVRTVSKIAQQRGLDFNGERLWDKKQQGIKLTAEEQGIWDEAAGHVGRMGILFEQTGLFRLRSDEMITAYREIAELREQLTGVTVEQQEIMRRREPVTGQRIYDLFPLDPLQQELMNQLDAMQYWAGTLTPLLPSEYQKVSARIGEYWNSVEGIWEDARVDGFKDEVTGKEWLSAEELERRWKSGDLSSASYRSMLAETMGKAIDMSSGLKASEYFADVPITLDDRVAFADEHNMPVPTFHPGQEILWEYYQITPLLRENPDTGQLEYDWGLYFAQIDTLIEALPDPIRSKFLAHIHREWTPSQILYWDVSRNYLRPYRNFTEAVIELFTPEQQSDIRRYRAASGPEKQQYRDILMPDGSKLISSYEKMVRVGHENMRILDPNLDAWVGFWGTTQTLKTPEAKAKYIELMKKYRPGVPVEFE